MTAASINGTAGNQTVGSWQLVDTTPRMRTGFIADFVDPYWGGMQIMYGYASGSIRQYGLCTFLATAQTGGLRIEMSEVPNTANLAVPVCVAMTSMTVGQFGWFVLVGVTPINSNASVAANTSVGIAAAGQAGANSAGKQLVGARNSLAATTTVAKANCTALSGNLTLTVSNSEGWFIGAYLSGTGIAAGTTVVQIDPSGTQVTLSLATTAQVNGTVTATYNNATVFYNVVALNNAFAQGAIT